MINNWNELETEVSKRYKVVPSYEFILFLVGIQEKGSGFTEYSKEEKLDLINLGRSTMLEQKGFLKQQGKDNCGWPIFETLKPINKFSEMQLDNIIKSELLIYFNKNLQL